MTTPLMQCGHTANARTADGRSICAICIGINPGAESIETSPPSLEGRRARCGYYGHKCRSECDSALSLAFFEHHAGSKFDSYYCGCYGWN